MQYLLDLDILVSQNDGRTMMSREKNEEVRCEGKGCNYSSLTCPWRSWRRDIDEHDVPTTVPYMWIVNEERILCRFCFDQTTLKTTKTYRPYWSPSTATPIDDVVMRDLLEERGFVIH